MRQVVGEYLHGMGYGDMYPVTVRPDHRGRADDQRFRDFVSTTATVAQKFVSAPAERGR